LLTVTVTQFVRFSHTALCLPPFFAIVRIYVCALLAILNSRDRIRAKLDADTQNGIVITMPPLRFTSASNTGGNTRGTMTDAVADTMGPGSTDPTSQGFRPTLGDSTFPSEV